MNYYSSGSWGSKNLYRLLLPPPYSYSQDWNFSVVPHHLLHRIQTPEHNNQCTARSGRYQYLQFNLPLLPPSKALFCPGIRYESPKHLDLFTTKHFTCDFFQQCILPNTLILLILYLPYFLYYLLLNGDCKLHEDNTFLLLYLLLHPLHNRFSSIQYLAA